MNLKIEYVPVSEVKPYANNAKTHPAKQIEEIKSSINQFGFNDPIAVWHGEIVEGHGRLIAATELGMEKVPIIRLDGLTEDQRKAYALVHNKLTMDSGFDFDLLKLELESIALDMTDFDFDIEADEEAWTPINGHNPNLPPAQPHIEPTFTPGGVTTGEAPGDADPYLPDRYDDDEIREYTDRQEQYTVKKRIFITYLPEQEAELAKLLHLDNIMKVVYDFDEVFK